MYKHLKTSMDKIFIQTYIIGQEKIFLLIKIKDYNGYNLCWHTCESEKLNPPLGLHHLNPPSLDSKLTSKRQAWEEDKSAPRDKGVQTEA